MDATEQPPRTATRWWRRSSKIESKKPLRERISELPPRIKDPQVLQTDATPGPTDPFRRVDSRVDSKEISSYVDKINVNGDPDARGLLLTSLAPAELVQDNPSILFEIPFRVFGLILEELPLHSRVVLSQTCRLMRSVLYAECTTEIQQLNRPSLIHLSYTNSCPTERQLFLSELDKVLPDYFNCPDCDRLHYAHDDVPYDCHVRKRPCNATWDCRRFLPTYTITLYHVKLAAKWTRLGYLSRVAQIMEPYDFADKDTSALYTFTFNAIPRLVDGRFIILAKREYKENTTTLSPLNMPQFDICSHHCASFDKDNPTKSFVRLGVKKAFEMPWVHINGTAPCCNTDFTIVKRCSSLFVYTWQDLGSGEPRQMAFPVRDRGTTYQEIRGAFVEDAKKKGLDEE